MVRRRAYLVFLLAALVAFPPAQQAEKLELGQLFSSIRLELIHYAVVNRLVP